LVRRGVKLVGGKLKYLSDEGEGLKPGRKSALPCLEDAPPGSSSVKKFEPLRQSEIGRNYVTIFNYNKFNYTVGLAHLLHVI
jgi:hypothetical protein